MTISMATANYVSMKVLVEAIVLRHFDNPLDGPRERDWFAGLMLRLAEYGEAYGR